MSGTELLFILYGFQAAFALQGLPLIVVLVLLGVLVARFPITPHGFAAPLVAALSGIPLVSAIAYIVSQRVIPVVEALEMFRIFSIWSLFGLFWGIGYGYIRRFGRLLVTAGAAAVLYSDSCAISAYDVGSDLSKEYDKPAYKRLQFGQASSTAY